MTSIVFLHAHPDDEAIFTGGTMASLAVAGVDVHLVLATSGELGIAPTDGSVCPSLGDVRRAEALQACELGVAQVHFLGFGDSGLGGGAVGVSSPVTPFADADPAAVAEIVSALMIGCGARALVSYDGDGIYGHPDHVQVHRVAEAVVAGGHVDTWYECTVDREYLHFVDTHIVSTAGTALRAEVPGAGGPIGRTSVEITATVDVRGRLDAKRRAIAAHRSQLPPDHEVLAHADDVFASVYGFEWYVRTGLPGPIELLVNQLL